MAVTENYLLETFRSMLEADVVLTPPELIRAAMDVQMVVERFRVTANRSSVIVLIQNLVELWAGGTDRAKGQYTERYKAWISTSLQDRNDFIYILDSIAIELYLRYFLVGVPLDEARRKTLFHDFKDLGCLKTLWMQAMNNFQTVVTELRLQRILHCPPIYLDVKKYPCTVEVCAIKTMETISSVISVTTMLESIRSMKEKLVFVQSACHYYTHILHNRGEVTEFLITADSNFASEWINLWRKVERASNLDWIYFMATSLTCSCGQSISRGSEFAILDNCRDLLCEQCARKHFYFLQWSGTCPVCRTPTKVWMSSSVFVKLKTRMKKRKEDTFEWRESISKPNQGMLPKIFRKLERNLVRVKHFFEQQLDKLHCPKCDLVEFNVILLCSVIFLTMWTCG